MSLCFVVAPYLPPPFLCPLFVLRIVTVALDSWLRLQVNVNLVVCCVLRKLFSMRRMRMVGETRSGSRGRGGRRRGLTQQDQQDQQTPSFICKFQKTIEVSCWGVGGGAGEYIWAFDPTRVWTWRRCSDGQQGTWRISSTMPGTWTEPPTVPTLTSPGSHKCFKGSRF